MLERFAPILIEKVSEELLSPVLISCTSAKGNKVKKLILNSVLKREKPNAEEDYAEWLSLYLQDEDKSIVNLPARWKSLGACRRKKKSARKSYGAYGEKHRPCGKCRDFLWAISLRKV